MNFLTERYENIVYLGRCKFKVNPAFDTVLKIQQLYKEDTLNDNVKIEQALKMLIKNRVKLWALSTHEKSGLLNLIYKECINTKKRPATRQRAPVFDFEYDAEYIYSSYMLDYGIDLLDVQGKLSWKKFIALFEGLSERTKIREVMRIRCMEIPAYNGHNQKQINEINELKSYYALPIRGGGGQEGLNALFSALEKMAVNDAGKI